MRRLTCRALGHTLHPDPGDHVLYCTRCHAMADLDDHDAAIELAAGPNAREWLTHRLIPILRWLHRCPECGTRPDRHRWSPAPRWDDDPVAWMLGIVDGHCPRCGSEKSAHARS